jgi:protein phosphatase
VRLANRAVIEAAAEGRGRQGMGSTLTAAIVEGLTIAVAHVGDSRAYLYGSEGLRRITEDHSVVADMVRQGTLTEEESRVHPNRSVITRALGSDPNMPADSFEVRAEPGELLLLCSDGLTGVLDDARIGSVLSSTSDLDTAVGRLVSAALEAGGPDNITVILVKLSEGSDSAGAGRTWPGRMLWIVSALLLVVAAVGGAYSYARSRAFLVAENGLVAVYRGVPGTFAGISLSWPEEVTEVRVADLPPRTADKLRGGIVVEDLEAAHEAVATYRMEALPATATPSP